ncbi:MAG TPA: hypothetical protein VFO76_04570 [Candidatus Kapabacteria bacterium]|nr:hypothetical protein [Candidatus Kapabacteria bacterium]
MSISGHHSDLIYLFLDGEATDTERQVLFEALKDSPQLQEELSTAMQSKAAFETDVLSLQPPVYLQDQIAEKAGVLLANLVSSPVAVASVATAPVAAPVIFKSALIIIGSITAGVVATLGIQKLVAPQAEYKAPVKIERSVAAAKPQSVTEISPSNSANTNSIGPSHTIIDNSSPYQRVEPPVHTAIIENKVTPSEKDIAEVESILPVQDAAVDRPDATQHDQIINNAVEEKQSVKFAIIEPASIREQELHAMIGEGERRNPLDVRTESIDRSESWTSKFSFGTNYITTAIMLPNRNVSGASTGDINQVVLSAGYDISTDGTIGVAAGKETFPIYLLSSGVQTPHQAIYWGGAWYRHVVNEFSLPFDMHLYGQALVGIGTPGPVGKLAVGLYWQASDKFSFMLAPEAMTVAFKQNGSITAGAKVGVTYSAMIHF